jgi:hypothetical protein
MIMDIDQLESAPPDYERDDGAYVEDENQFCEDEEEGVCGSGDDCKDCPRNPED